jgi:hypothetical protein
MSPTSYQAAPPRIIDITRLAALLQPLARRAGDLPDAMPQMIGDLRDRCERTRILARRATRPAPLHSDYARIAALLRRK